MDGSGISKISPATTPSSSEQAEHNVIIAADGDVVLVTSETNDPESPLLGPTVRIRVSSTILSYASPVFAAMLGPTFKEGQDTRSATSPKEIELFDDNYLPMQTLCEMLHFKTSASFNTEPSGLLLAQIFGLAVVVDKYQCAPSICLASEALLGRLSVVSTTDVNIVTSLAAASLLLDQPRYFALFTRRMAMDTLAPFRTCELQSFLSASVLMDIEEQRMNARNQIAEGVASMASFKCPKARCPLFVIESNFTAGVARSLSPTLAQWPPRSTEHTVGSVLTTMSKMNDHACEATCDFGHTRQGVISKGTMLLLCLNVDAAVTGICLTCAKAEVPMFACGHRDEMKKAKLRDPAFQFSR